MQYYCLGFLFDKSRELVALIEKQKPEWQRGKLNGIGGKVENETLHAAMVREFREETGVEIRAWEAFAVMLGQDWSVRCFRAFDTDALISIRSMEAERVVIADVERVRSRALPVIANLTWLIPLALDQGSSEGQYGPSFADVRY